MTSSSLSRLKCSKSEMLQGFKILCQTNRMYSINCLLSLLLNGKVLFAHHCMMMQNLGMLYCLTVDKLYQDFNLSAYIVIQKVRTWREAQVYWFMAPLRLGRSFQEPWTTIKRLSPFKAAITPSGMPVLFSYHESLCYLAIGYAFVLQVAFPASKMFEFSV